VLPPCARVHQPPTRISEASPCRAWSRVNLLRRAYVEARDSKGATFAKSKKMSNVTYVLELQPPGRESSE
jgi:hypothetical protein